MTVRGQERRRARRHIVAVALVFAWAIPCPLSAQTPAEQLSPPRPPAPIRPPAAPPAGGRGAPPREPSLPPPPSAVQPPTAAVAPGVPIVPPGQVALALSARFGRDPPSIT